MEEEPMKILQGNCKDLLTEENFFDACVTDAPYGISFMGKKWDYDVPSVETFRAIYRSLKPGAYLLCFAGARTQHRMACNIEDAGFEIRDTLLWLYGSGFPKGANISKAIDKIQGGTPEVVGTKKNAIDFNNKSNDPHGIGSPDSHDIDITVPSTPDAKRFDGYNTNLKPLYEPIVMARKPISEKTIAKNCLKWGTGGINIDACRVGEKGVPRKISVHKTDKNMHHSYDGSCINVGTRIEYKGRYPSNVILDEEVLKTIRGASRFFYCPKVSKKERNGGLEELEEHEITIKYGNSNSVNPVKNHHPTVKPVALMEYFIKLVTPPIDNPVILDPFMGSGSTLIAATNLGVDAVGIDLDEGYCEIARLRVAHAKKILSTQTMKLFGE